MNRVPQHPVQAFLAALAAVGVLSIMDAVMKALVIAIGILAVSVWRSLANLLISGILYLPRRSRWPSRQTLRIHVGRGIIVTIMAGLFFWGIGRVPLAQAIALTFIAPLIALILAAVFLGEQIGPRSVAGSLAAFAGVIVIVMGQARAELGGDALLGSAAIIGSALCYAVNIVLMRHQALAAKPFEINFFQSLTVMVLWLGAMLLLGPPDWPTEQWQWVVVAA
ncbi:MAG TPA: DMT family transporter, partial [Sphingomicrobium sp.]|nr:DMT family transporter [Sphingomicrobium sp.]